MGRSRGGMYLSIRSNYYPDRIRFLMTKEALTATLQQCYPDCYSLEVVGNEAILKVPAPDIGVWIGVGGRVSATLTRILGTYKVRVEAFEFI